MYIQGSGWRTLEIIETLERDLGLPCARRGLQGVENHEAPASQRAA